MDIPPRDDAGAFPVGAGILLGLGLGGFFDGIVLHQLLQWHHMVSGWHPAISMDSLELNTRWDGIFHAGTYVFLGAGLFLLWRRAHLRHAQWPGRMLAGAILLGWGLFNMGEGIINHLVLGIHHVNETVEPAHRPFWDFSFLAWGAVMAVIGWRMTRQGASRQ
jgi:uncharacterized membrane protein